MPRAHPIWQSFSRSWGSRPSKVFSGVSSSARLTVPIPAAWRGLWPTALPKPTGTTRQVAWLRVLHHETFYKLSARPPLPASATSPPSLRSSATTRCARQCAPCSGSSGAGRWRTQRPRQTSVPPEAGTWSASSSSVAAPPRSPPRSTARGRGSAPSSWPPALGGQLMAKGVDVENFPGLLRAHGSSMVQDMRAQAQAFSARFVDDAVASVNVQERPFALRLNASGEVLRTSAVIVAMGADSRWLNVAGEETLRGRGVSTCAACDGFLFRGKACAVIGGGETAMEEALFLARICTSVTVVHRRSTFRARSIPSANPRLRLPTGKFSGNVCWPIQRCLSCGTRRSRSFLARPRHQRQHPAPAMLRIDSWLCCYETPSPSRPNSFLPMRRLWPSATSQTLHSCRDRCACSVLLGTWRQKAEAPPRPCRGSSPPATSRTPSTGRQSLRPAVAPRRRWTRSGG
mmetsp:Transcript_2510/g.8560  ORF Transcript_2510/g.8560 Transcript_2510/m.8560 type:complete len:459 (-) Transcript_2510:678-2054(-)